MLFTLGVPCLVFFAATARAGDGAVVLHGGGNVTTVVKDVMFELAGGKQGKMLVIPTADPDTPEDPSRLEPWQWRGVASVALFHAKTRAQAESEAFVEPLKKATGVWISGGRQGTLAAIYLGTPVERELVNLIKRGGVVGGTSAGAAIQTRVMIVRGEVWKGFDIVPSCIVDQHFLTRNRQDRLWHVLSSYPQHIGIGVDEDTAAVIRGDKLSVVGESTVSICVAGHGGQDRRCQLLKSGDQLDLKPLRDELIKRMVVAGGGQ